MMLIIVFKKGSPMSKQNTLFKIDSFQETPHARGKLTGYKIYDAEQKRRIKHNNLPDLYPDLPLKKYDVIYADPPWDYGGKMQFDKSSHNQEDVQVKANSQSA